MADVTGTINYERLKLPRRKYGVIESYAADGGKLGLPANKYRVWTPTMNYPNQTYINAGIAAINLNQGQYVGDTPFANRAIFITDPGFLKSGAKPTAQWTSGDDARNAILDFLAQRGGYPNIVSDKNQAIANGAFKFLASGAHEAGPGSQFYEWRQSISDFPVQYRQLDEAFAEILGTYGGYYFGDYDGHLNLIGITGDMNSVNSIEPGFSNPATALQICKDNSGFGNPYFTQEYWRIPNRHGLINTYHAGSTNPYAKMVYYMSMYTLHSQAMIATGAKNKLLMSFEFSPRSEFAGDLMGYKIPVEGGTTFGYDFPLVSGKLLLAKGIFDSMFTDVQFSWEGTQRSGIDPSVLSENPNVIIQSSGKFTKRGQTVVYSPSGAPYPTSPQGYGELTLIGSQWYGQMVANANTQSFFPVRYRKTTSGGYNSNGATTILDRFKERDHIAFGFGLSGSVKQSLVVFGGAEDSTCDFDMNRSSPLTLDIPADIPSVFLLS